MADLTPEEREKIYQEEKARLEAQEKLKKERDKNKGNGCLLVIILFFMFIFFASIFYEPSPSRSTTTPITSHEKSAISNQIQDLLDTDPMALRSELISEKILDITVADDWYSLPTHLKERYAKNLSDKFARIRINAGIAQNNQVDYPTVYIEDLNGKEVAKSDTFGVKIKA